MRNKYNLLIGSFSAASNVSDIIPQLNKTTQLSFSDYATAAPHMDNNKYIGGPVHVIYYAVKCQL